MHQPPPHRLRAVLDAEQDDKRDEYPNDGVSKRKSQLAADSPQQHGQRGPSIDAGVLPVGHQRRRPDLSPNAHAHHSPSLIPDKTTHIASHPPPHRSPLLPL